MKKDFVSLADTSRAEVEEMLARAASLKADLHAGKQTRPLIGKTLAMIFEKPSLRTRVTFETGIKQLGGASVYLAPDDIQLGARESVSDIARNLSRWVDLIMARTFSHGAMLELAEAASIPVINGLTDRVHPCQMMADAQTLQEHFGRLDGLKVAFIGDGNNVVNSWLNFAALFAIDFRLACPPGYEPTPEVLERAQRLTPGRIEITHDPKAAAEGVDAVYTDVWTSMGQEAEAQPRRSAFSGYQVNAELMACAAPEALVMHCLPAHRGEEISAEVVDGPHSVVFDQAENRLHAQKAILCWLHESMDTNTGRNASS
ncbi:MAG: ornithine carbamoyltransferase [Deltaproteobacteria bacterium]